MTPDLLIIKKIPFVRLFLFFVAGIVIEWYLQIDLHTLLYILIIPVLGIVVNLFLPLSLKFTFRWLNGVCILLLFALLGAFIIYSQDIRHKADWYQNNYTKDSKVLVTIEEPLVTKTNSYKALATV